VPNPAELGLWGSSTSAFLFLVSFFSVSIITPIGGWINLNQVAQGCFILRVLKLLVFSLRVRAMLRTLNVKDREERKGSVGKAENGEDE
jgi:hypothetical protein